MGLFDTFVLKVPIQCQNCFTGGFDNFQTKDIGKNMETYAEGESTVRYFWRNETPEEYTQKMRNYRETKPWFDSESLFGMTGCVTKSDVVIPNSQLPDGVYTTYTFCHNCKEMFYVQMEVKNGIFVGVHLK